MTQTINIIHIPGHSLEDHLLVMDMLFPFVYQFNFHFSDETVVSLHSRPANSTPDSVNLIAGWRIKERH